MTDTKHTDSVKSFKSQAVSYVVTSGDGIHEPGTYYTFHNDTIDAFEAHTSQQVEEAVRRGEARALLRVSLALPFVSDGDKTEYAKGVRDTVHNLRLDIDEFSKAPTPNHQD